MSSSIWPGIGISAAAGVSHRFIEEFEELPEHTLSQTVPFGTRKRELDLPKYLNARFEAEEDDARNDEDTATPSQAAATSSDADKAEDWKKVKVSWVLDEDFSEQDAYDGQVPGIYVFEAELSGSRYELGGAELPAIEVEVLAKDEKKELESTPSEAQEEVQEEITEEIPVTDWTYLDGENLSEDGSLTLYGAEDSFSFEAVVSLLPSRIEAVTEALTNEVTDAEEGSLTKILPLTWECPEYLENREKTEESGTEGSRPEDGVYLFEGKLPKGYVLSEAAAEIAIPVTAKMLEDMSLEEQAKRMEQEMGLANTPVSRRLDASAISSGGASAIFSGGAAASSGKGGFVPSGYTFVIGSEAVLRELQEKVNSGETWSSWQFAFAGSHYKLTGDIALTGSWTPIGTEENPFSGTFDGDGYTVDGLTIQGDGDGASGLFGVVEDGAVRNLGVTGGDLSAEGTVGLIAGILRGGEIVRCYTAGTVTVSGDGSNAGGIAGTVEESTGVAEGAVRGGDGRIENCYSLADVFGKDGAGQKLGGLAGYVSAGRVEGCYSTGNIAGDKLAYRNLGGIVGFAESEAVIRSCAALNLAVDNFYIDDTEMEGAGRIVGVSGSLSSGSDALLEHNYGYESVRLCSGTSVYPGNMEADTPLGRNLEYAGGTGFEPALDTIFTDSDVWKFAGDRLPTLKGIKGQEGTIPDWILEQDTWYISTEEDLKAFRDRVNAGNSYQGKTVILAGDIELTGNWTPIGIAAASPRPFSGTFDGRGHTISNLKVDTGPDSGQVSAGTGGLFGSVKEGTIENLGVKNVDITLRGGGAAGAVVAILVKGTVRNCYSTGRISVTDNDAGYVSAGGLVGGGMLYTVANCYSKADLLVDVQNETYIGGVAGAGGRLVINCYSTGKITGTRDARIGGVLGAIGDKPDCGFYNCAALNPSVERKDALPHRLLGAIAYASTTPIENHYAFSGMKVNGNKVTNGTAAIEEGADLAYDSAAGTFDTSWLEIFDSQYDDGDDRDISDIWKIEPGRLPTLVGIGGQDGTIPPWIVDSQTDLEYLYIGNEAELKAFRDRINYDTSGEHYKNKLVILTSDIRLTEEWEPISAYTGHAFDGIFDGGGHVISNLVVSSPLKSNGLFGYVEGGTIKNLSVEHAEVKGNVYSGAIVGELIGGKIINCSSVDSTVESNMIAAGGICGASRGNSEIRNCYSTGTVGSVYIAGGILGGYEVKYPSSSGNGDKLIIENCYSTAAVIVEDEQNNGKSYAGGLVGYCNGKLQIQNSAALNPAVVSPPGGATHRIIGMTEFDAFNPAPQKDILLVNNYAVRGLPVNGEAVQGDDGTGAEGRDGALEDITQDTVLFPESDWILQEGCYPRLVGFSGQSPIPLEGRLEEPGGEIPFGITVSIPDAGTFRNAKAGYGAQPGKTVTVTNPAGNWESGKLTAALSGDAAAFVLSETTLASIPAGGMLQFTVTPADGLPPGIYQAEITVTGLYGQRDKVAVRFTVTEKEAPRNRSTRDSGVNPAVLHGSWIHLEDGSGGWKFKLMSGGYASNRWGLIGGRWYYFGPDGVLVTGWQQLNGNWYYLSTVDDTKRLTGLKEGDMITGWYFDPFYEKWFYLDESGAMVTGWREIDGKWYYFNPQSDGTRGAMAVNAWIDGNYVDQNGIRAE